jgi:hypothetical protein
LKRKIKFTKKSKLKIKIKRMRIKLKEIRNQGYGSNDEIENILKFNKKNYESNLEIKILMVKYEMLYNKRIKLIFLIASIEFNVGVREKRKKKKRQLEPNHLSKHHIHHSMWKKNGV